VRKAPQTSALGFRQTATKLLVIVQLLMGEIPERATFMVEKMRGALQPYLVLTKAVRVGDLAAFEAAVAANKAGWERDGVSSLISRLRNNVIKTGLRKLNTSYSRIPLVVITHTRSNTTRVGPPCLCSPCLCSPCLCSPCLCSPCIYLRMCAAS
jgi:hypothetical protein